MAIFYFHQTSVALTLRHMSFFEYRVIEDEELTITIYLAKLSFFQSDKNSKALYPLVKLNINSKCSIRL